MKYFLKILSIAVLSLGTAFVCANQTALAAQSPESTLRRLDLEFQKSLPLAGRQEQDLATQIRAIESTVDWLNTDVGYIEQDVRLAHTWLQRYILGQGKDHSLLARAESLAFQTAEKAKKILEKIAEALQKTVYLKVEGPNAQAAQEAERLLRSSQLLVIKTHEARLAGMDLYRLAADPRHGKLISHRMALAASRLSTDTMSLSTPAKKLREESAKLRDKLSPP